MLDFIDLSSDGAAELYSSLDVVAPLVPAIVEAAYEKLLSFDITAKSLVPHQIAYTKNSHRIIHKSTSTIDVVLLGIRAVLLSKFKSFNMEQCNTMRKVISRGAQSDRNNKRLVYVTLSPRLPGHIICIAKSHLTSSKTYWVTKLKISGSFPLLSIIQVCCNKSAERYSPTQGLSSINQRSDDPELTWGIERCVARTYDERAEGNLFYFSCMV
jgi:hypothetical protein